MKIQLLRMVLCAPVALALALAHHQSESGAAQTSVVGLIEEISGRVLLKARADSVPIVLDPKRDLARLLHAGEQLQCAAGASVRIRLSDASRVIKGPSEWIVLTRPASEQERTLTAALNEYGRTGGRSRGGAGRVFSPPDTGVVMPGDFVARWMPGPATRTIALAIFEPGGQTIWRQDNVDGARGLLASESARAALILFRRDRGQRPLSFRLSDSTGEQTQVTFSLLSTAAETTLKQALASWDMETGPIVPHLGRAMVYAQAGLTAEAAEAYEAALGAAPESRDLLLRTIAAHDRTGNTARAAELMRRLPPGTVSR